MIDKRLCWGYHICMKNLLFNDGKVLTPVRIISDSKIMGDMLAEVLSLRFSVSESAASLTVVCTESEPPRFRGAGIIIGDDDRRDGNIIYLPRPLDLERLMKAAAELTDGAVRDTGHGYTVDVAGCTVSLGRESAKLTTREMELFCFLCERCGEVVSREKICTALWDGADSNVCDVYVSYLRKKLRPLYGPGALVSVRGKGYMLADAGNSFNTDIERKE